MGTFCYLCVSVILYCLFHAAFMSPAGKGFILNSDVDQDTMFSSHERSLTNRCIVF